jgi:hypothetical protein
VNTQPMMCKSVEAVIAEAKADLRKLGAALEGL